MKKISLLLGALGGAMAGYLFSNERLRDELAKAKNAEEAGKVLAKHLQHDGKKIGAEVQRLANSPEVKENFGKAKTYVQGYAKKLNKDLQGFMGKTTKAAKKNVVKAAKKSKKFIQTKV